MAEQAARYTVTLNFEKANTVVNSVDSPLLELIVDRFVVLEGGGQPVGVSPDSGNSLVLRSNGLYVSSLTAVQIQSMINTAIDQALGGGVTPSVFTITPTTLISADTVIQGAI